MSELGSKPVTMLMFSLYEKYQQCKSCDYFDRLYFEKLRVAEEILYFIQKLDETRHNPEILKYFKESYLISDLIDNYSNHVDVLYDEKYNYKSTVVKENEKGKIIREIFFNPNDNTYLYSYLHKYSGKDMAEIMDIKRLVSFFEYGLYNSVLQEDKDRCTKAYADLSDEGLRQYKEYIDKNIYCLVMANAQIADNKDYMRRQEFKKWHETMLKYGADYRVDAYDRACKLEKAQCTNEEKDDEERE